MGGPQASSALKLLSLVYHLCHALAAVDSPASPRLSHRVCPLKHERLLDIEIAGSLEHALVEERANLSATASLNAASIAMPLP